MRAVLEALPKFAQTAVVVAVTGGGSADTAHPADTADTDGADDRKDAEDDVVAVVVAALWQRRLINAVVLVAGMEDGRGKQVATVTAFSFEAYARCRDASPAVRLGAWSRGGWQSDTVALFPRNAKLRLGGCEVRVSTAEVPPAVVVPGRDTAHAHGVTVNVLREMGRRLGYSLRLQDPTDGHEWGWAFTNGTGTGMIGDVMSGETEIAAGDYLPMGCRHALLDMSVSTYWTCMSLAVPSKMGS